MARPKSSVFQRVQLGREAVSGALATVNRRMPNMMMAMSPMFEIKEYTGQGFKAPNVEIQNKFWTDITYDGPATFGEMAWILASIFGYTTPTPGAGASQSWVFAPSLSNPDTPATYTIEQGDQSRGYRTRFGTFADMTLAVSRDELKVSGKGIGQQFEVGQQLTAIDEVQTLSQTGVVTAGTFTATIGGQTAAALAWDITAAAFKTAIEALTSVGAGNSTVTGGPLPGTPLAVTLLGDAANQTIVINSTGLTGGTFGNVISGGGGAATVENVPMVASGVSLFIDTTFGGIGTTKVPRGYNWEFSISNRWAADWVLDAANVSFADIVEMKPTLGLKLTMESNATSDAFVAQINAGTTKYMRLNVVGPTISGGTTYLLNFDVPFAGKGGGAMKDQAGVWAADWEFSPMSDPTANYFAQATLVNQTAAL